MVVPDLMFWSELSEEDRKRRAVLLGLRHFRVQLEGRVVAVFTDNSAAVAYLKNGGTVSPSLNREAQEFLRWAESLDISLSP